MHKKTIIDGETFYKIKTAKVKVNLQKNKNQLDFDTVKQGNEAICKYKGEIIVKYISRLFN